MGLIKAVRSSATGYDLQDELAATLDSIQERGEARQADVQARLAELEAEASVLANVVGYVKGS